MQAEDAGAAALAAAPGAFRTGQRRQAQDDEPRPCRTCGELFTPTRPGQVHCRPSCRDERARPGGLFED